MISGKFEIILSCNPLTTETLEIARKKINNYVKSLDRNAELEETNFAGISYVLIWKGTPENIGTSQQLLSFLANRIKTFMKAYELQIILDFEEEDF